MLCDVLLRYRARVYSALPDMHSDGDTAVDAMIRGGTRPLRRKGFKPDFAFLA
jgi:hypothetical protein